MSEVNRRSIIGGTDAIVVEQLTKRFGSITAVNDLSFTVQPGVVTGLLGPNGAGKTTTLRMLLGLVNPTSGRATIGGRQYVELTDPLHKVGAVLDATSFHPGRTAGAHLRWLAAAAGLPAARVGKVLRQVGLDGAADRRTRGFSLGMKQRLSLAAALLGDPHVLVLDEPATGLDPEGMHWLRQLLRGSAANGRAVLMSSHVLAEVEQTVDEVVVIARGRLVRQALLVDLTSALERRVRVRSPQADALQAALSGRSIATQRVAADALLVPGVDTKVVGEVAAAAGVVLHELAADRTELEDVFLQLTDAVAVGAAETPGGAA